jgi:16S rRNA (uracil1498-N3)-methyltransferase
MRAFFLTDKEAGKARKTAITLDPERSHYLLRVLRLSKGSRFPGVDEKGQRFLLELEQEEPCRIAIVPEEFLDGEEKEHYFREMPGAVPDFPPLVLIQSILKGKKMDQVLRQATEAGVNHIMPVFTSHCVVRIDAGEAEKKRQRWLSVVREAVQQSGAPGSPEVHAPQPLETGLEKLEELEELQLTRSGKEAVKLFFHEKPLANATLHRYLSGEVAGIFLAIGPEGGFSPGELSLFSAARYQAAHLPGNILRAETAVVYALGAVKTIIAEKNAWRNI